MQNGHTKPQLEPVFGCTYGASGVGKTTDNLYSFPRALFVAPPGALKPARTVCGFEPRQTQREASTVMEVTEMLPTVAKSGLTAMVVDDFSLLVERTVAFREKRLDGWALWGQIDTDVREFRDGARRAGIHVLLNAHELVPDVKKDGKLVRGGPALPGKLPNKLPPATDICLRAVALTKEQAKDRPFFHPTAYRCSVQESDWSTKDRHGCTPDYAPMNIGEILRAAGYSIQRLAELDWQEEVVERIAGHLMTVGVKEFTRQKEILEMAAEHMKSKLGVTNQMHVLWTLRDGYHRALLRQSKEGVVAAALKLDGGSAMVGSTGNTAL